MGTSIAHLIYAPIVAVTIAFATVRVHDMLGVAWWLAYLIAINLVAFAFFTFDKIFVNFLNTLRLRVPEDVLVWMLALPGGIVGSILGMYVAGHKTGDDKHEFRMQLLKAYAIQVTLVLIARRWALVSNNQLNSIVESLAHIVLNLAQQFIATLRAA
jgi:uncharacterized membrane protein YsdA (DUF1294 family)